VRQVLSDLAVLGVLVEPPAQPGPLAKEGLVRNLHRPFVDGQQAAVREDGQDPGDARIFMGVELANARRPPHDEVLIASSAEAEEDRPGDRLLLGR